LDKKIQTFIDNYKENNCQIIFVDKIVKQNKNLQFDEIIKNILDKHCVNYTEIQNELSKDICIINVYTKMYMWVGKENVKLKKNKILKFKIPNIIQFQKEYFETLPTITLLRMLDEIRIFGFCSYPAFPEQKLSNYGGYGHGYDIDEILLRIELSKRPHVPNKLEQKKIIKQKVGRKTQKKKLIYKLHTSK